MVSEETTAHAPAMPEEKSADTPTSPSSADDKGEERTNKREFIARVAKRTGFTQEEVLDVYEGGVEELMDIVRAGGVLTLTGFGRFYPQKHRGHRVQFADKPTVIDDYSVLKFSAIREINRMIGDGAEGETR